MPINKHSSLLRAFVNYGRKTFYNIGPLVSPNLCIRYFNTLMNHITLYKVLNYLNTLGTSYTRLSLADPLIKVVAAYFYYY
jgi:hypothetical protein